MRPWLIVSAFLLGVVAMFHLSPPQTAYAGRVTPLDSFTNAFTTDPNGNPKTQVMDVIPTLYTVEGIKYQFYTDRNCNAKAKQANGAEAIFTLGSDGKVASVPSRSDKNVEMLPGTYYLQEVKGDAVPGPPGTTGTRYLAAGSKGIYWNGTVYEVVIEPTDTVTQPVKIQSVDDVITVTGNITKRGKGENYGANARGDGTLAGGVFKVEYFGEINNNPSGNPLRTWYFKTDASGNIDIANSSSVFNPASDKVFVPESNEDNHYIGNTHTSHAASKFTTKSNWTSSPFYTKAGQRVFLLGTYRITEMAPPEGYTWNSPNNNSKVVTMTEKGERTFSLNFEDPPIKGNIRMRKTDSVTGDLLNGDMKLDAEFTVYNVSKNAIVYGNRVVPTGTGTTNNNKVGTFKTAVPANTNGQWWATTLQNNMKLDYGTYLVKETTQAEGHIDGSNGNASDDTHVERVYLHVPQSNENDNNNNTIDCTHVWTNAPRYNGLRFLKVDWNEHYVASSDAAWNSGSDIRLGEGNAKLIGAKFAIVNKSVNPVYTGPIKGNADAIRAAVGTKNTGEGKTKWWTDPGETCMVIEVKAVTDNGIIASIDEHYKRDRSKGPLALGMTEAISEGGASADGVERLPYGTYAMKEIEAPPGYLLNHRDIFWQESLHGNRQWYYVDGVNLDDLISADHPDLVDVKDFDYQEGGFQP